jgi:DNA-binding PadR family transcriptional regulator
MYIPVRTMPERTIWPTVTELAVLGMLEHLGGGVSGYDLKKFADRSLGYLWAPSRSQLYVTLPRLLDAKLVVARAVVQTTRPDKRVYRINAAGRRQLVNWLESDEQEPDPDRSTFMLKFFFGAHAAPEAMQRQLTVFRDAYARRLETYRALRDAPSPPTRDRFTYLALLYGIARAEAAISWADDAQKSLRATEAPAVL